VAVGDGIFAVAVKAAVASANGTVATFTTSGVFVASYEAGNRPGAEAIANWKVLGKYVPDAIAAVAIDGTDSSVSANEGDAGDDDCYSDEERVKVFTLASQPHAAGDNADEKLDRLKTAPAFPSVVEAGEL
jgi:hypothetical protein